MNSRRGYIIATVLLFFVAIGFTGHRLFSLVNERVGLAAVFINNSEEVSLFEDQDDIAPGESSAPDGEGGATIDEDEYFLFSGSGSDEETPSSITEIIVTPVSSSGMSEPVSDTTTESTSGGTTASNTPSQNPNPSSGVTQPALHLIQGLTGSNAVVGASGGVTSGGVSIYSNRVRTTLHAQGVASFSIPESDTLIARGATRNVFSRSDFALFVSQAALIDEHLQNVSYLEGVLATEYRALGRLFGFVPLRYTIKVTATFADGTLSAMSVKFPWYSFFLAKGVSQDGLEQLLYDEVGPSIEGIIGEYDAGTRAFVSLNTALRRQFGET